MITVRIWKRVHGETVGHASIEVNGKYYSLWPDNEKKGAELNILGTKAKINSSYRQDIKGMENKTCDKIHYITEADEEKVEQNLKKHIKKYNLAVNNCSSAVGKSIMSGLEPKRKEEIEKPIIWTPDNLSETLEKLD